MKCTTCGAALISVTTDLPFKVHDAGIVILKNLPVLQCARCSAYLIDDAVQARVDEILGRVDMAAELEIIRFAA